MCAATHDWRNGFFGFAQIVRAERDGGKPVLGLTTVLTILRKYDSGMDGDKTGKEQI